MPAGPRWTSTRSGCFCISPAACTSAAPASECHISASALSRAIQRLEQERRPAACSIATTAASSSRAPAHAACSSPRTRSRRWDDLEPASSRRPADGCAARISIFATVTACQSFLPELLSRFRQAYPDIHIRLETGYAADALAMLRRPAPSTSRSPPCPTRAAQPLVTRVRHVHAADLRRAHARLRREPRASSEDPIDWARAAARAAGVRAGAPRGRSLVRSARRHAAASTAR